MKLRLGLIFIFLFSFIFSHSQGLMLKGNNYLIDDRSTFNVFERVKPVFKERLIINFEMAPMSDHPLGYIMRIIDKGNNTVYNILYDDYGERTVFKFNHEGKEVVTAAGIKKEELKKEFWIKIGLDFDLINNSVILSVNGEKFAATGLQLQDEWSPVIHFGRSEHLIDNLTFGIRNLIVQDDFKRYFFPLNKSRGEDVHDAKGEIIGHVSHSEWLINSSYHWKNRGEPLYSDEVAGLNFNAKKGQLCFFNKDSILFYTIGTKERTSERYINKCPIVINLGTNFFDSENNRIYVYEVAALSKGDVTVACLDLNTFQWTALSTDVLPTQLHHHSSFYDEKKRAHIIFGGFGNLRYSNCFYSYMVDSNSWDTLNLKGDIITPRYFSSLGCSRDGKSLYLFGGMGNESGDQTVGRIYYYELYVYDLETNVIRKKWEIPWNEENIVPVRNMVLTGDSTFYTLCYAEHFSHSYLRLYCFSIHDGSYKIVGDSIPITSEKIKTNANLYFNDFSNELYCIIQEFANDDVASDVSIYSLFFPPATAEELLDYNSKKTYTRHIFGILGVVVALILFFVYKKKRCKFKNVDELQNIVIALPKRRSALNSIYLFGDLSLFDRDGKDIAYMFSSKLRQAFLLLLQYSINKEGITSHHFSEQLWADKSEDKVKNSRGVLLNNLRKILHKLDGISLVYEKGYYKIVFEEGFYCDYKHCMSIISENDIQDNLSDFVGIVSRGKFLKSLNDELFDSFKGFVEKELEPILLLEAERAYENEKYKTAISLCKGIFNVDPINEQALFFMINSLFKLHMKDVAKREYALFVSEYKWFTGNIYATDLSKITSKQKGV